MSQIAIGTIMLFASLAILMVLRFPIAYSLGISAVITATYMNIPYLNLFQKMTTGLSSFTFIAVPFFIMMAQVMCDGQITKKLMRMCNIFVGQIRGGTAIGNILVSMLFGGISGSSAADVSSIGAMLIPAMVDEGYDVDYSVAVTVTSSVEGVIIPPSQNMLFYAISTASGLSISTLLMCGYVPGVLLTLGLMIPAVIIAIRRHYPLGEKCSLKENLKIFVEALFGLGAIVVIIIGTSTGICSATEAAAVAAVYAPQYVSEALYQRPAQMPAHAGDGHEHHCGLQRVQLRDELPQGAAEHDRLAALPDFQRDDPDAAAPADDAGAGLLHGYGHPDSGHDPDSLSDCGQRSGL